MPAKHKRRRYAAPIGGFFVAFATIGIATVIFLCILLTGRVLDNSSEKKMLGDIILPVVMFNPPPFEKATDIEMPSLLTYSMWSTLLGEKRNSYQYAENGELMVPASDLDVAAAKLFGPDVQLQHQSFGEFDNTYFYDDKNAMYNVPNTVQYNVYTPSVEEITKNGDYYELYVGYIPSGISWQSDYNGNVGHTAPEKHMNYIMQKSKTGYFIVKLQDPENSFSLPASLPENQQPDQQAPSNAKLAGNSGAESGTEPESTNESESESETSGESELSGESEPEE